MGELKNKIGKELKNKMWRKVYMKTYNWINVERGAGQENSIVGRGREFPN